MSELVKAAEDAGLHAAPLSHLSLGSLQETISPAILHVRCRPSDPYPNHYVLLLRVEGKNIAIYDAPQPVIEMPLAELGPLWDGTLVALSREHVSPEESIVKAAWRSRVTWSGGLLVLALALGLVGSLGFASAIIPSAAIPQVLLVTAGAIIAATAFHLAHPMGFRYTKNSVLSIQHQHLGSFLPSVNADRAMAMLSQGARFT